MVLVEPQRSTHSETVGPLTNEALVFLFLLQHGSPITQWDSAILNNPKFHCLLDQAKTAAERCPDYYNLGNFLHLHAQAFPDSSVVLLNISRELLDDLFWKDIYFFSDLADALDMKELTVDDLISSLGHLREEETPQGLIALLQYEVLKEKKKKGEAINRWVF